MELTRSICLVILFYLIDFSNGFVEYRDMQAFKKGLAYPYEIHIHQDHDVMSSLLKTLVNQDRCILRTPDFTDIDLAENKDPRYEKWGKGCGVKIKNATAADQGRWQLVSIKGDKSLQGLFTIIIEDQSAIYQENDFILNEGDVMTNISFMKPHSQYCVIGHERMTEGTIVHGDCVYPVGTVEKRLQGKWNLGIGMAGSIEEILLQRQITVITEDLDIGFMAEPSIHAVHVYCNLKNSFKRLEFCRFERIQDKRAFNLNDGLGKGRYSYYGRGMYQSDCGITITNPSNLDYGSWRCIVGVLRTTDNSTSVLRGATLVSRSGSRSDLGHRLNEKKIILSVIDKPLTVVCDAPESIIYCSLKHPNGSIIAPNATNSDYSFDTKNLPIGQCSLIIKVGRIEDSGDWTCYMGAKQIGLEMTTIVNVRVTGAIAAVEPEMHAHTGDNITLHCVTAGNPEELQYCRFISPNGTAFGIDDTITEDKAIGGEFYFPTSSQIYHGDCSVTIQRVAKHHFGEWKCMAMIRTEDVEYMDSVMLISIDNVVLSTASVTGILVGVGLLVIIVGVAVWKRGSIPKIFRRNNNHTGEIQQARFSTESGDSAVQLGVGQLTSTGYGGAAQISQS